MLAAQGIPYFRCEADELTTRLPVLDTAGIAYALWEPEAADIIVMATGAWTESLVLRHLRECSTSSART